jgi:hypothetical protein
LKRVFTGSRDIRNTNSVKSAQATRASRRKVMAYWYL